MNNEYFIVLNNIANDLKSKLNDNLRYELLRSINFCPYQKKWKETLNQIGNYINNEYTQDIKVINLDLLEISFFILKLIHNKLHNLQDNYGINCESA
jgi:hypothetical protein